ncbi:MAG TPA: ABC transporter permease [Terracidiphilus sp.]|nr:ABC transporter permease [Terracidiphilus sp.]
MSIIRRMSNLFLRSRVDREIDAELQSHIDLRTDENVACGMSPEAARRDALVRFGSRAATQEKVAAADTALGLDRFWFDLRYAARQLRRSPGFTITAVLTLTLGIGSNTAVFSSMDAVVLRPLAVPHLDRVVTLFEQQDRGTSDQTTLANYADWLRESTSFENLAAYSAADMSMTGSGDPTRVSVALTSPNFFQMMRADAFLGRIFADSEARPGRDAVAVLNYGFWQRRFGADATICGRKVELDQRSYTVIGVMPKTMQYPAAIDLFVPLAPTAQQLSDRKNRNYFVIGRLRDGVTLKQAQAEMRTIGERLAKDYPATNAGWSVRVEPLLARINGEWTPMYYRLIMGATLFVLLVVCANVANLQLARGVSRRSEIAMRSALGATRWRIVRQLLTENILLALIGSFGGVIFAAAYLHILVISMPQRIIRYIPGWSNTSLNGRALLFSLGLAALAGLASGFTPALEALRVRPLEQLKAGGRSSTGSRGSRLRSLFAVSQIALAVALVIGAALISKGMFSLLHIADAYQPDKVLTYSITLPDSRYDTPQKKAAWYADSLEKLRALPGASHAEVTTALPHSDDGWVRDCEIENRPTIPGKYQSARQISVSPGYFDALHIAIVSGRNFNQGDSLDSVPVALISRRLADLYFGDQNPIGHRIRMGGRDSHDSWVTIVGIAEETTYDLWLDTQAPVVYLNMAQHPSEWATFTIFTEGNPLALAAPARKAVATIDAALPLDGQMTWRQNLNESLTGLMYSAGMLGLDALIALLLSAIGIFGVMANLVGERTREIGVRVAMGATRQSVLALVLRRASWLTAAGIGTGLVMAFFLARMVAHLLRGVRPDDPLVFITITLVLAAVALGSSWIPARRAARIDPMQALRSE